MGLHVIFHQSISRISRRGLPRKLRASILGCNTKPYHHYFLDPFKAASNMINTPRS
jgi:hypothetical protein